jgi:predicted amidophosphoribosyltransferase
MADESLTPEPAGDRPEKTEEFIPCPDCGEPVYPIDAFCRECGQPFCPRCYQAVDDDDEVCPHCHTRLFFECPLCEFELTAGSDMCPNCHALFRVYCDQCQMMVLLSEEACPNCGQELIIEQRESARIVQTVSAGLDVVKIVACTECGSYFDPLQGPCPSCGLQICPSCQMVLFAEESFCPRCDDPARDHWECPSCHKTIPVGSHACLHCEQEICPECGGAVGETDSHCSSCGIEFSFACPECDQDIPASSDICPHCQHVFSG